MATNTRNTRAAVKAQQEIAASSTPQTRSKTTNEPTATKATATGTKAKPKATVSNEVPESELIATPAGEVPKKLAPRCLACTRIAQEDVRHHHTKCPIAKNNAKLQADALVREVQIANDVERQTQSILAARPFATKQSERQVPATPPGLALPSNVGQNNPFAAPPHAPPGLAQPQAGTQAFNAGAPHIFAPAPPHAPPGLEQPQAGTQAFNARAPHIFAPVQPRAPPGLAQPQAGTQAFNAGAPNNFAPAQPRAPPGLEQPQAGTQAFNAGAPNNFAPAQPRAPPGLAQPQAGTQAFNAGAPNNFAPAAPRAPPGLAQPQAGTQAFNAVPPLAPNNFAPAAPHAPPGLAQPQVQPPSFHTGTPRAPHGDQPAAPPGLAHAESPSFAIPALTPAKPGKAPVPGAAKRLFRFAPAPAQGGRQDASPWFAEPAPPSSNGQPKGRAGAQADGTTPFLGAGAPARAFAQTTGKQNTQKSVFRFNTAVTQMPSPAQTPELPSFAAPADKAHALPSATAAHSQAFFNGSEFGENVPPITPVRQTYQDDPDAMQVDEMLVATPFSVAGTEDPSPCKGKGKKEKEKKEHGGFIPNGWKSTNKGQLTPLNGLHRNTARPEKIETYAGMSHDFNPKFMAIMQKAEYMSDRLDAWIICAALPAHGLGEVRIWENDDMARDAPDFKFAFRDAIFERLHDLREQRNSELKKESDENQMKLEAAEAAAKEKDKEVRAYREQVAKYERESKRLKKELRVREAKNESKKQKSISRKRAFRANSVVVVSSSEA